MFGVFEDRRYRNGFQSVFNSNLSKTKKFRANVSLLFAAFRFAFLIFCFCRLHPYKLRNSDSKKVAQLSEVIQLPKLSNSSVVYVPVISTAKSAGRRKKRQKIASSVMTSTRTVTTVTQSPSLYFKTVAVTASKVSENENQPPKMMRSLKPQPSPSKDLQSPQTQIMELPLSPCNVQSPTLAVNYAHANPKLSRVPIARSSPHEISSLQSQAQTKIQINQPQTGAAAVVVSQSNLECRKTLPDIGDMFKLGFIFRGEKVLSYQCEVCVTKSGFITFNVNLSA